MPPDIHPLPDSVAAYVRVPRSLLRQVTDVRFLNPLNDYSLFIHLLSSRISSHSNLNVKPHFNLTLCTEPHFYGLEKRRRSE
jgi:hypothetical protein